MRRIKTLIISIHPNIYFKKPPKYKSLAVSSQFGLSMGLTLRAPLLQNILL